MRVQAEVEAQPWLARPWTWAGSRERQAYVIPKSQQHRFHEEMLPGWSFKSAAMREPAVPSLGLGQAIQPEKGDPASLQCFLGGAPAFSQRWHLVTINTVLAFESHCWVLVCICPVSLGKYEQAVYSLCASVSSTGKERQLCLLWSILERTA